MSKQMLFRREVLAERRGSSLGPVLLVPRVSDRIFASFAAVSTIAVFALLFFGRVPRKVHVSGLIVPEGGLVQVFASQPGVVTDVAVEEGTEVEKGTRLVTISTDHESTALGVTGEHVARQLAARKESLLEDRKNLERIAEQQQRALRDKLVALDGSEKKLTSEIALQGARVQSAVRRVTRQRAMIEQGVTSAENVQTAEEGQIEQTARLRELERDRLAIERDRIAAQADLDELPLKTQRELASVDRSVATLEEQIAELAGRREIAVPAPQSGVVMALQAKRGGHPDPRVPLLAIVPKNAKLEAQLYCSSAAIGFLKAGQRVLLRYEAFPHQKFGHYEGTVTSVSQSAVSASELDADVAGLPSVAASRQPTYRVTVALASQSVRAYGSEAPLHPGMQVDADVVLERRRLVEWMLEPIFTVSGTWKQ